MRKRSTDWRWSEGNAVRAGSGGGAWPSDRADFPDGNAVSEGAATVFSRGRDLALMTLGAHLAARIAAQRRGARS